MDRRKEAPDRLVQEGARLEIGLHPNLAPQGWPSSPAGAERHSGWSLGQAFRSSALEIIKTLPRFAPVPGLLFAWVRGCPLLPACFVLASPGLWGHSPLIPAHRTCTEGFYLFCSLFLRNWLPESVLAATGEEGWAAQPFCGWTA